MDNVVAFMIYSYIGATLEHISYWFGSEKKQLANPIITGFPIYGIGAYLIIIINSILQLDNMILNFLVFGAIITLFEFIIGLYVGAGSHSHEKDMVKSWDYSGEFGNYKGIVSIRHFISWGILGLVLINVHPAVICYINNGIKSRC